MLLKWLSVLILAAFAAAELADTDVPELVIDKTYIPADCTVKAQKGDKIRVHYVSGVPPLVRPTVTELVYPPDRETHQWQEV
jgi:hypothetical protein